MEKKLRILSLIIWLGLMQLNSGSSIQKSFFFVQITDTQMGFISDNQNMDEEIRLYSETVRFINKVKPDFVVITGDFVNNRTDTNQIHTFKEITSRINKRIPVFLIPGNHDIGQKPTAKHIEFYYRFYDNVRFDFIHKNVQFIGINSCFINAGIEEEDVQWNWLKKTLESNPKKFRRIIFTHHPFFTRDINEKDSYSNIAQPKRSEYMNLFSENNVIAVFAGHYHNNAEGTYKGVNMITTSAVGKQLGQANSGFRVVKVFPDSISHEYIEIENLHCLAP